MKSRTLHIFLSIAFATLILSSCDKKEEETPVNNNTTAGFSYNDAFGVLVAVKSVSYTSVSGFDVPVEVNSASAFFPTDAGATTFVDAGAVTIEGKSLSKIQNNIYSYTSYTDPLLLSDIEWSVSGSASVPAFSKAVSRPLPTFGGYTNLPATISQASGVSISLGSSVYAADSVIVMITSSNDKVAIKTFAGNAASATFSAADLSVLSASNAGSISVSPYNISTETISGKKYYFVNESSYLKMAVNITD